MDDNKGLFTTATLKLLEQMPAIIVLMVVAYHQQQQINALIEQCIVNARVGC